MTEVETLDERRPRISRWYLGGVVLVVLMLFMGGLVAFYQFAQILHLGNLRYATLAMYENHLSEHFEMYKEFPVCLPVTGEGWLTVEKAVCANQYDPTLGVTHGRTYKDFLSFTGKFHEARILMREGSRPPRENIAVVLLIDFTDEEVRLIDEKVRSRQFQGADGLGSLLRQSRGELYFRIRGNSETLTASQSVELLQNFYDGYEPLIDVHR
jgi:hypothetical protein